MDRRAAWRRCAVAGCFAFACGWLFGRIPGLVACGPTGGLGPVIAFEVVRDAAEVAALFGSDPCRATLVGAQRTALLLDAFGFIPGYTLFLALAARALAWPQRRRRSFVTVCVTVFVTVFVTGGLCDEVEGGILTVMLRDVPHTSALFAGLFWIVRAKFVLLGLGTLALGCGLVATRRVPAVLFGLVAMAGAATALYGLATLPTPLLPGGFALAWFALLLAAFTAWLRPSPGDRPGGDRHQLPASVASASPVTRYTVHSSIGAAPIER